MGAHTGVGCECWFGNGIGVGVFVDEFSVYKGVDYFEKRLSVGEGEG
jgi:hypothetical protein